MWQAAAALRSGQAQAGSGGIGSDVSGVKHDVAGTCKNQGSQREQKTVPV